MGLQTTKYMTDSTTSSASRCIIHLDLDAFFCSVEVLNNPDLNGKPIVVGGQPDQRGVVAAASYPAREFGIHSAMPMAQAVKRCRELIILPPNFKRYKSFSRIVMGLIREAAPVVQQVSVDEAYMELTSDISEWEAGIDIGKSLQQRIRKDVGLSSSLGISTSKMVAKIASDFDKPNGFTVVPPGEEQAFLAPLPVGKVPGIGPKTVERLQTLDIKTVRDLRKTPEDRLRRVFGKWGLDMVQWARGIDIRPVIEERETKSVSKERTFPKDISDEKELGDVLEQLGAGVARALKEKSLKGQTVTIKLRDPDFQTITRQVSIPAPTNAENVIIKTAQKLLFANWMPGDPVRLFGVGVSGLTRPRGQMELEL